MGAWGYGHFENDAALDFMAEVEEAQDPKQFLMNCFDNAHSTGYLETDDGCNILVAAVYVDNQVNGTKYSKAGHTEPLDVDLFQPDLPEIELADLRPKALAALNKVIGDDSELNELWQENKEEYSLWRTAVEQLIKRLEK